MARSLLAKLVLVLTGALLVLQVPLGQAQAPGVSAKPLLKSSFSGDDTKETTLLSVEFAPGAALPRHTHPGDEYATVLEGTVEIRQAGQEPRRITAGQSYHNARGVVHETKNVGDGPARLVITFVLEKNLPLASPAPAPQ